MSEAQRSLEATLNEREDAEANDTTPPVAAADEVDTLMQREFEENYRDFEYDDEEYQDKGCEFMGGMLLAFSRAASLWVLRRNITEGDDAQVASGLMVEPPPSSSATTTTEGGGPQTDEERHHTALMNRLGEPAAIYGVKTINRVVDEYNRSRSRENVDDPDSVVADVDLLTDLPRDDDLLPADEDNLLPPEEGEGGVEAKSQPAAAFLAAQRRAREGNDEDEEEESAPLTERLPERQLSSMSQAYEAQKQRQEAGKEKLRAQDIGELD